MWSEFKLQDVATQVFATICSQINQTGYIESRGEEKYFTIVAPQGGRRCYELVLSRTQFYHWTAFTSWSTRASSCLRPLPAGRT